MMATTIHVCASRIFAPLSEVDRVIVELPADATVIAYGSTQACRRAVETATAQGLAARNVTLDRDALLAAAEQPESIALLFTALDPATKRLTQGIGQIAELLAAHGVSARQIAAPLPGRVCEAVSKHRELLTDALAGANPHKRRFLVGRVLKASAPLILLRDEYADRLDQTKHQMAGDEMADGKWCRWLMIYERICDELNAGAVLLHDGVAA